MQKIYTQYDQVVCLPGMEVYLDTWKSVTSE